jgi:hypothetical protein
MKKLMLAVAMLTCVGSVAIAEMDSKAFPAMTTTNAGTDAESMVLRGTLHGVYIDVTAPATNTVVITDVYGRTLFTKSGIVADTYFPIVVAEGTTAGAAATFNTYWATNGTVTANAQAWYGKAALAGKVTATLTGQDGSSSTNPVIVTVIYDR